MKSTVEQLGPTRVRINVEVPFDELKPNFDRAYKKLAQQVRIPGFRPGKAPARLLEARLGRGVVIEEVVNEAIPTKYAEAVSTSDEVKPLGRPEIEVTKLEDGDALGFAAEVDVRPEITVPAFGELAVTVDDVEVSDDDVTEQLDTLRERFATLTTVDRPATTDDFVTLDLSATVDGTEVEEATTTGMSYQVGSGQLIDGIDEAVTGASAGDSRTFPTTLVAGEYADKEAEVTVTVTAVQERDLPEADDDFAQLASEFDTLGELIDDLRARLGRSKSMEQGMQARDKVLEALLEVTEVPLPEAVVDQEVEVRSHDAVHSFDHDEERLAEWLAEQDQSREEFDAELRTAAEEAVKTQLVLDAIADAEDITVDDSELTERILYQAQRMGVSPEDFVQRAQEANQIGAIYADVRRGKALASVVRGAKVIDGSGNPVDMDALFGAPAESAEAAESAESAESAEEPGSGADAPDAPDADAESAENTTAESEPAETGR